METTASFAARVLAHTGLSIADIPDAPAEEMLSGSIACARGGTTVVLIEHAHQDSDGTDWYRRAVVVGRTADLPRARRGATGCIGERIAPRSPRQRRVARRLYGRVL